MSQISSNSTEVPSMDSKSTYIPPRMRRKCYKLGCSISEAVFTSPGEELSLDASGSSTGERADQFGESFRTADTIVNDSIHSTTTSSAHASAYYTRLRSETASSLRKRGHSSVDDSEDTTSSKRQKRSTSPYTSDRYRQRPPYPSPGPSNASSTPVTPSPESSRPVVSNPEPHTHGGTSESSSSSSLTSPDSSANSDSESSPPSSSSSVQIDFGAMSFDEILLHHSPKNGSTTEQCHRRAALEADPWVATFTKTSVTCRGCGKTLQMEKRGKRWYYPSNWIKHREQNSCEGIRKGVWAVGKMKGT
ncbi:hypothetical protein D9758_011687 [Tetrapyrgos nigripes]|uniref:Uncharacterized protein n=1 Tax=Tetrapyrgos nigripes TaxID=182062 RepID=A0A8H5GD44_9AGAR|nr:hypothetical protein D9758_011687 [Tetrapyrgos nigripes]